MWHKYFIEKQSNKECNDGLTEKELSSFQRAANENLKFFLPFQYAEFLKIVNGYEKNNKILYSADTTTVPNKNSHKNLEYIIRNTYIRANFPKRNFLYIGETPDVYYAYDYSYNQFVAISRKNFTKVRIFYSFDNIIEEIISE